MSASFSIIVRRTVWREVKQNKKISLILNFTLNYNLTSSLLVKLTVKGGNSPKG